MERFFSKLSYRPVDIWTPADISQFSFIVQKSLCYLNLQICQSYAVWDGNTYSDYPSYSYSKDFINTEEKCRKILSPCRHLFYTLHLDLPIGREWSLKTPPQLKNVNLHLMNPHIANIVIDEGFYSDIIYSFVEYACRISEGPSFKIMKWFLKLDVLERDILHQVPHHITKCIMECMHPELDDLDFVRDCFRKLDLITWVVNNSNTSNPGTVTNLLYQFHRIGRNVDPVWTEEFTDFFLSLPSLHLVGDVLKLKSAPSFSDDLNDFLREDILLCRNSTISAKIAMVMTRQRHSLLLQVFWVYIRRIENLEAASEFLRLIWSSVPDSLLSRGEIAAAFAQGFTPEETEDVSNFYSDAVGGLPTRVEPRSLKQYCRTTIRGILYQRKIWLPEGIKKIGLPKKLQSYLNLET